MSKIKDVLDGGALYRHMFFCPGCNEHHGVDETWQFNGDYNKPTFNPSILVTSPGLPGRCHSFVRDGRIEFLSDCTHDLTSQIVDLPEIEL